MNEMVAPESIIAWTGSEEFWKWRVIGIVIGDSRGSFGDLLYSSPRRTPTLLSRLNLFPIGKRLYRFGH